MGSFILALAICGLMRKWMQHLYAVRNKKELKNKVVVITGGASGLGRLMALQCKQLGAWVVILDVNDMFLKDMEGSVDLSMKCDVSKKARVEECKEVIMKRFGRVDVLINNAGIVYGKPMLNLSEERIRKTFEVNVISHFWTIQVCNFVRYNVHFCRFPLLFCCKCVHV